MKARSATLAKSFALSILSSGGLSMGTAMELDEVSGEERLSLLAVILKTLGTLSFSNIFVRMRVAMTAFTVFADRRLTVPSVGFC
jgi:hypothetical protein